MAMIYNHYEINVALNGEHFFATDMRSIQDKAKLDKVLNVIKNKFPESEGYDVTAKKINCYGEDINTK